MGYKPCKECGYRWNWSPRRQCFECGKPLFPPRGRQPSTPQRSTAKSSADAAPKAKAKQEPKAAPVQPVSYTHLRAHETRRHL
eukprot:3635530-Prorocentrum_lima.AAC.1